MATSYNGWEASPDAAAIGINTKYSVCGTHPFGSGGYAGGIKSGDVSTVFTYLITRLHNEVEPMMTGDGGLGYGCWGYSYRANVNNPSQLSCHASGTAIDYNAPKHPNGTSTGPSGGGGWTGDQYNKIKSILSNIGVISWLTSNDPMHFEIQGSASKVAEAAKRLGGSTPQPQPPKDWFDMATQADLEAALRNLIPEIATAVWMKGLRDRPARDELLDAADGAEKIGSLPVDVWMQTLRDKPARDELLKAADK